MKRIQQQLNQYIDSAELTVTAFIVYFRCMFSSSTSYLIGICEQRLSDLPPSTGLEFAEVRINNKKEKKWVAHPRLRVHLY